MNGEQLLVWSRVRERTPFDPEAWNEFVNFMNGNKAARAQWRTLTGVTGLAWFPELPLLRSYVETEIQVEGNGYDTGNRAALKLGARAGAQATRDAALWIVNENSGSGYRFLDGILFGASNSAIDAAAGTLIRAEALTALRGIDLNAATFVANNSIIRVPGISGRTGWKVVSVDGTTGLRLRADLANNTYKSRLLYQTEDAESTSIPGLGVIPSSSGAKAAFLVFADDDADNTHFAALVANATDSTIDLVTSKAGTGTTRDVRFLADTAEIARLIAATPALRLANTRWLSARNAADSGDVNLIRLNGSDVIEIGAANQRVSFLGVLSNDAWLAWRNGANSGNVNVMKVDSSDVIVLGATGTRLSFLSPLANNSILSARNAANSATHTLIGLNGSDQVVVGETGRTLQLQGTVIAPAIDPPTNNGQLTNNSVAKGWAYVTYSGGVPSLIDSFNVSSITDTATGVLQVFWDRDFSTADYAVVVTCRSSAAVFTYVSDQGAGYVQISIENSGAVAADPVAVSVAAFGTLS